MKRATLMVLLYLLAPTAAAAQDVPLPVWDAPSLMRPGAPSGLSVLLVEPHRGDLGGLVYWRSSPAPIGIGFRGGIVEEVGGDAAGLFGIDLSGDLTDLGGSGDPQVIWWTGAGLGFGSEVVASFPLGLVLGWNFTDDGVSFAPNLGGHLALDVSSWEGDDVDLEGALDLGVDIGFQNGVMIRFSAAVADRESLAVGVRLPR